MQYRNAVSKQKSQGKINSTYSDLTVILIIFVPLETEMNTPQSRYELCHFSLTISALYLVKPKIAQKQPILTTVRFVEQIVPNFHRNSFNVPLCHCLLENSFSIVRTNIFIFSWVLIKKFNFKLNMVNFNM